MVLGINTASEKNSIALFWPGKISKEITWSSYRTQSKELLPKIDKLLAENKVKLSDLRAIAVFQGPGSYTGLRVGISVANALAWGLDIPVIGIKCQNSNVKCQNLHPEPIHQSTDQPINHLDALEIAKKAEKIIKRKKLHKFSKIIIPYYGSPLK